MKDKGLAHIGIGSAKGEDKAMEAVKIAVESPLLETKIDGATHVILNISGDIALFDVDEVGNYVRDLASDDANVIVGAMYDENMTDEATITVIATGLVDAGSSQQDSKRRTFGRVSAPSLSYPTRQVTKPSVQMPSGGASKTSPTIKTDISPSVGTGSASSSSYTTGIQKPQRPKATVEEKKIKVPDFLNNLNK